jgi:hypothetical protein
MTIGIIALVWVIVAVALRFGGWLLCFAGVFFGSGGNWQAIGLGSLVTVAVVTTCFLGAAKRDATGRVYLLGGAVIAVGFFLVLVSLLMGNPPGRTAGFLGIVALALDYPVTQLAARYADAYRAARRRRAEDPNRDR